MKEQQTEFIANATCVNNALDDLRQDALANPTEETDRLRRFIHQARQPLSILINAYTTIVRALEKENQSGREIFSAERLLQNFASLLANHRRINRQCREHDYIEANGDKDDFIRRAPTTTDALVSDLLAISFMSPKIKFDVLSESNGEHIMVDRTKIVEIVETLTQNAIDALEITKAIGAIQIYVSTDNKNLIVKVINTGSTIAKENIERIFEKGFSTKRAYGGEGLGLYVAREIAKSMGGNLIVDVQENSVAFVLSVPK
jgi:signal transduction histidine kinase